jgi:hypothetical protein
LVHGATAAYDRAALEAVQAPQFEVMLEDFFLTMMFAMNGARFEYIDEPLVQWRRHRNGASRSPATLSGIDRREQALATYSRRMAQLLSHVVMVHDANPNCSMAQNSGGVLDRLRRDAAFHQLFADWYSLSIVRRIKALTTLSSYAQVRSLLPRVFGTRFLSLLQRTRRSV